MKKIIWVIVLLNASVFTMLAVAKDSVANHFMQEQLALENTTSYQYDEKRHLELLDEPWSGAGLLFASTDGTLIKLQLHPHRKIMAITPGEMIYFDHDQDERHRMPLGFSHPLSHQALMFQKLLLGKDDFSEQYAVDFARTESSWSIHIKPKKSGQSGLLKLITMQGSINNSLRYLKMIEFNGDSSVLTIQPIETGEHLDYTIERLLREATGQ